MARSTACPAAEPSSTTCMSAPNSAASMWRSAPPRPASPYREGPQLVPAGGGVLDWTIVGAAPGDVVHLVVAGIETYAGPEEGVGLCCTQTVDIVIPRGSRLPGQRTRARPQGREACRRRASAPKMAVATSPSRVTNVGAVPYNGPIVLDEVTLPGSASINSGPNAPWICVPATSPMSCTHPATTLNPGEFVDLKIGFKPGPGWPARFIRNCAEYDYAASGKAAFGGPTNDKACAQIPICRRGDPNCRPPDEKKVDLTNRKDASACGVQPRPRLPVADRRDQLRHRDDQRAADRRRYLPDRSTDLVELRTNPAVELCSRRPCAVPLRPSRHRAGAGRLDADLRQDGRSRTTIPATRSPTAPRLQPVPDESDLTNNEACADQRIPHRNPGTADAAHHQDLRRLGWRRAGLVPHHGDQSWHGRAFGPGPRQRCRDAPRRRHAGPGPDRHARRRGMELRRRACRRAVVPDPGRRDDARNQPPFRRDAHRLAE